MKNLLAIVLVALLATTFTFALPTNTGKVYTDTKDGWFKATVLCTPSLTGGNTETLAADLGTFFAGGSSYTLSTPVSVDWTVGGPASPSYNISWTLTNTGDGVFTGTMQHAAADIASPVTGTGTTLGISCGTQPTYYGLSYVVTAFNAPTEGTKTLKVTVSLEVTIL